MVSVYDQLKTLIPIANREGLPDAADYLGRVIEQLEKSWKERSSLPKCRTPKSRISPRAKDPHRIIGKEVKSADRSDYGLRILGYDPKKEDYIVEEITWSTRELREHQIMDRIDQFKITYRFDYKHPRKARKRGTLSPIALEL